MRSPTPSRTPDGRPKVRRHPLRAFGRAVSWHRRKLAAVAAVATVLSGIAATAPPAPPSATVVRTTRSVTAGAVLDASDLETVAVDDDVVPDGVVTDPAQVVGRRVSGPLDSGEILTSAALVSARSVSGPGRVLAPVRIADADTVALLRPGDVIDVVASDTTSGASSTAARRARVVSVPPGSGDAPTSESGALVLLDVDASSVAALTRAVTTARLTPIWS